MAKLKKKKKKKTKQTTFLITASYGLFYKAPSENPEIIKKKKKREKMIHIPYKTGDGLLRT